MTLLGPSNLTFPWQLHFSKFWLSCIFNQNFLVFFVIFTFLYRFGVYLMVFIWSILRVFGGFWWNLEVQIKNNFADNSVIFSRTLTLASEIHSYNTRFVTKTSTFIGPSNLTFPWQLYFSKFWLSCIFNQNFLVFFVIFTFLYRFGVYLMVFIWSILRVFGGFWWNLEVQNKNNLADNPVIFSRTLSLASEIHSYNTRFVTKTSTFIDQG